MINIIHYEDDIFFLNLTAKRLADGLKLELDPSLFHAHVLDEILFLSRSIVFFLDSLKTTQLKVNRVNYLKSIFAVNKQLIEILNSLLTRQVPFAEHLADQFDHLTNLRTQHSEYEYEIRDAMTTSKKSTVQDHEALSEEEYRILLSPEDE
ncbi:MAG TPA: hypothetical protein ENN69_09160 [Spirochaetia bacterium]|nr:hypothetical protein [Spirochaetia bacterium]